MSDEIGRGKRMDSSVRMGRWKEPVSSVHRARKKMYWSKMGWDARRLGDSTSVLMVKSEAFQLDVPFVPFGLGGNGGVDVEEEQENSETDDGWLFQCMLDM